MLRARRVTARIAIMTGAVFLGLGLTAGNTFVIVTALASVAIGILAEVAP